MLSDLSLCVRHLATHETFLPTGEMYWRELIMEVSERILFHVYHSGRLCWVYNISESIMGQENCPARKMEPLLSCFQANNFGISRRLYRWMGPLEYRRRLLAFDVLNIVRKSGKPSDGRQTMATYDARRRDAITQVENETNNFWLRFVLIGAFAQWEPGSTLQYTHMAETGKSLFCAAILTDLLPIIFYFLAERVL